MQKQTLASDCYQCVIEQAISATKFANISEENTNKVIDFTKKKIEESKTTPLLAQHIIRNVADKITLILNKNSDFDIYEKVKKKSNILALEYLSKFQLEIDSSSTPLETGMQIAAAGNIIDFGAKAHDNLNIEKELSILNEIPFSRYDIESFKKLLSTAKSLLYICDNSGEIVFDMLFIKIIKKQYPKLKITAALREKPIINDATLEDAFDVGLNKIVSTISSGSIYPGTILEETTDKFKNLFNTADLILSKGQGNFETLLHESNNRLFFLLRIKCEYMAKLSKEKKDNLVLIQANTNL